MTRFKLNTVAERLVEMLLNDPITSQFCITSANLTVSRTCRDTEDEIDGDWWDAHNNAMIELLTASANLYR